VGDLTLIDSAGIGALVAACVRSRRRGGDVKLLRLNDRNRHALEVTRLDSVFQAFDAEEAAVASFGGASLP
jgi:anti-anti-sigma factor